MSRPPGIRNQDYDDKREALVDAVTEYVLREDVFLPSFRQLAIAASTSEPTLKHYFSDRTGLVVAVLDHLNTVSDPMRAMLRQPFPSISDALHDYKLMASRVCRDSRFMRGHIFGIRESLADPSVFSAYIDSLVTPGTEAFAERLVKSPGGPRNFATARTAASLIFSNVLFLACRRHLIGASDQDSANIDLSFEKMTQWLLNGMLADPEGQGLEKAKPGHSNPPL